LPSVVEALEPSHAQVVELLTTHAEVQTFDAHPPTNGIVGKGTLDGVHVSPEGQQPHLVDARRCSHCLEPDLVLGSLARLACER
jgi:hypothetical protein